MSQGGVLPWRGTLTGWTERNPNKFNTGKCKVLHPGISEGKPLHQYRLGADWLESSSVEKTLGSWWTTS